MDIQLSDHFTYQRLIRFVLPSIAMMIFTSIYGVVDGFFVSNFAGKTAFAAVNLIMPFPMIVGTFGFMMGTGGSAIVAKTLGEQKPEKAKEYFSFFVKITLIVGIVLGILGFIFCKKIALLFGADEAMLPYCVLYGRIILLSVPSFMLQNIFQSFLVTAGKPDLGLKITVAAGVTNMILDAVMVGFFRWGVSGAAIASFTSQIIGGMIPFAYFLRDNDSSLRIVPSKWDGHALLKACTNGASELMTNVSMSLVNVLYNYQLMRLAGENGVAAYGVIMYVNFIFIATFIGYSIGSAPIVGYHFGAQNHDEMHNVLKKSLIVMAIFGVVMTVLAFLFAPVLSSLYVGYDQELFEMTKLEFRLYSLSFLIMGFNIYASSFFTALGNGAVSAGISFLRTLLFQVGAILILPLFLDLKGIWLSIGTAEILALFISVYFFKHMQQKYKY